MIARLFLLALLAVFALAAACGDAANPAPASSATTEPPSSTPAADLDGPFRILALGDSYTIGERVPRPESWPMQLRTALREDGFDVDLPLVTARNGWTTDDLIRATEHTTVPTGPYDLVTLLIGVNNEFSGWLLDEFRPDLVVLMGRALSFAGGDRQRVMVLSIPDYGVTPAQIGFAAEVIAASIDRYNGVVQEEAARFGFEYVDVTEISRQAADDLSLIAPDNLHPSGAMYALWIELLEPLVSDRFERLGAVSGDWSAAQVKDYDHEIALRRHP